MKFIFEIIEIKHQIEKFRLEKGAKFYDFLKKLWYKKIDFIKNLFADNFNKNLVILAIILLSFVWRSSLDYEAFSAYNLKYDDKIQIIDNFLAFNNLPILNLLANLANLFASNSLFIAEIIISLVGIFALYFSNKILKDCHNIEKNLLLILMAIMYFLPPRNFIENSLDNFIKNEFFTQYFINLALMMPIISYLYIGKNNLKIIAKFIFCLLNAILILQNIYFIILLPFLNYEFFLNPKKNYQNILLQIIVLVALILDLAIIKYFYNYWLDGVKINFLKTIFSSFEINFKNSFNSFINIKFSRLYYDFIAFFILYFLGFFGFFMLNKTEFNKNFLALIFGLILVYFAQNFNPQIGNLLQALLITFLIFNVKFYHQNLVRKFYKYWFILLIILIASLYSLDFKFLITHIIFWSFPVIFLWIFLWIFLKNFRNKIFFNQNIFVILLTILLICLSFFWKIQSLKIYFVINFFFALWSIIYLSKIYDFFERLKKSLHFSLVLILLFVFSDIFRSFFQDITNQNINNPIAQNIVQKTKLNHNRDDKILQVSANFLDFFPTKNYFPTKINNLHLNILNQNDLLLINNYKITDSWFSIIQNYQDNLVNDFVEDFLSQIQNSQPKFIIFFNKDLCNIGLIEFLLRNSKFQNNFINNYEFFDNYSIEYFNKTFKYQPLQENFSNYEFDLIKEIHKIRSEFWQLPILEIYKKTN